MKKINCKHELNRKQEIEARRFRKVILEEDIASEREKQLLQRVTSLYYSQVIFWEHSFKRRLHYARYSRQQGNN